MYRNSYQAGFLSVLYSIGSKPLELWSKTGAVSSLIDCSARVGARARARARSVHRAALLCARARAQLVRACVTAPAPPP